MAVSKIELANGDVLIDLTNDSVTAETLAEGVTAHGANGEAIVGTMRRGEDLEAVLTEQEQLITTLQETLNGKASGGGGGSVEAWTGTVDGGMHLGMEFNVYYLDETFTPHTFVIPCLTQETITIAAGTFVVVTDAHAIFGTDIAVLDDMENRIAHPTANGFYIELE